MLKHMKKIPKVCIFNRWTSKAIGNTKLHPVSSNISSEVRQHARFIILSGLCQTCVLLCVTCRR